jgi:membrane dipeptidase
MNRIGMMVDISHVSDDTIRDVLEITTRPVIASHSSCRALCDHPRNLPDDLLRAIGQNGGYVGINFYPAFVDQKYLNALRARQKDVLGELNVAKELTPAEMDEKAPDRAFSFGDDGLPRPPFDLILDHIDHAVKVAGIDHIGIGSDLDTINTPAGLDDVTDFPKITAGLLKRGYSEEDIRKILGGNLMRVFQQVVGR